MLQRLPDGNVVDTKTGERLTEEIVYLRHNEGVKTFVKPPERSTEKEHTIPWKTKDQFVKLYVDNLRSVVSELTGSETMVMMFMVSYIDYYSNMLRDEDDFPISNKDITRLTGFTERHVNELMDSLVAKRIFARNRVGRSYQYFANPFVFTKGNRINATLYAMFKNYKGKQGG